MNSALNASYEPSGRVEELLKWNLTPDPRTKDVFLMSSPFPITIICLVYVSIVLYFGPRWMKDRKPFQINKILIIYNAAQTIFSGVLFYHSFKFFMKQDGFQFKCLPLHPPESEDGQWVFQLCYVYFLSKISELSDTMFFVLRKKDSHISLLHVFHHAVMPFSVWFGVRYHPGGNLAFFGIPNLFVHIWMYLYYMLAAMGPKYQKYIWWKKHITEMQLIQFLIVGVYMLHTANKCPNLNNPQLLHLILILDTIFVVLFCNFYIKSYFNKCDTNKSLQKHISNCEASLLKKSAALSR